MKKLFAVLTVFVFAAGCLIPAQTASAWEYGHAKINPWFKSELQYDSNIFYDRDDPDWDLIWIETPGIDGMFKFGPEAKHNVFANYKVDLGIFTRYSDQNYGNHDLFTGGHLDFDRITVDVDNRWLFTSSRAGTEFDTRVLRKEDTLNAVIGWHFNKIDFDTGYRFYWRDFLSDTQNNLDRYENEGWITGYVQVAPKTQALFEFDYKNIQYWNTNQRNANAFSWLVGVRGQITPKISGLAKAGYKIKNYNSSSANDFSNLIAHIDLMYDMNARTDMSFSYHREPFESTYSNSNYYTGDHFNWNLTYNMGYNFYGILDMMYMYNAYPSPGIGEDKKRSDHIWHAKPRLEYHWKDMIVMGCGYMFKQRASNIGSRSYMDHVTSVDIKITF